MIDVGIQFSGAPSATDSHYLNQLQSDLLDSDLIAEAQRLQSSKGEKDGGLIIGLTIASLAISAVGALASVVSTWGDKRNYSVSFTRGNVTLVANHLTPKQLQALVVEIEDAAQTQMVQIQISKEV